MLNVTSFTENSVDSTVRVHPSTLVTAHHQIFAFVQYALSGVQTIANRWQHLSDYMYCAGNKRNLSSKHEGRQEVCAQCCTKVPDR